MSLNESLQENPYLNNDIKSPSKRTCCLVVVFTAIAFVVLASVALKMFKESNRRKEYQSSKERMEKYIAEVEQEKSDRFINPDARFLEMLVKEHPECVSKIKGVDFCIGDLSDERFRFVAQFPNLEQITFYDTSEADTFLNSIRAMPSILELSFSETSISDDGMRAIASFPNLKRLYLDQFSKDVSFEPLKNHASLEELEVKGFTISDRDREVLSSMPKLKKMEELEGY